jgi:hypothetical protein
MAASDEELATAIAECRRELHDADVPSFTDSADGNRSHETLLRTVLASPDRDAALRLIAEQGGLQHKNDVNGGFPLSRALLAHVARVNVDRLDTFPVEASVKAKLCDFYRCFLHPLPAEHQLFDPGRSSFVALSKMALLERFPAGQFDWEVSGLPRSWLAQVPPTSLPRLAYFIGRHLRGFAPCIVPHMAYRRKNPLMLIRRECEKAWYRMAISAELQPGIKGLVASSWFLSRDTFTASPHLSFVLAPFSESGALITTRGAADEDEGFLTGSEARKKLYQSGDYKPTMGLVVWSRHQMISWAHSHPELADG